jgi:hypothetical protein
MELPDLGAKRAERLSGLLASLGFRWGEGHLTVVPG